jgi:Predicted membrane protein
MIYIEKKRTKFLALPICFTTYTISDEKLTITSGFLNITVDDAFMYKIQDVRLTRSLVERIFKLGTITCYTGDTTHPELKLLHIKNSGIIKDFLMTASEESRRKRRTMHTMDIDAMETEDDVRN